MKGFKKRGLVMLGAYHVERCYGGPEEGGWWHDWWSHLETRLVPMWKEEEIKQELCEKYPDDGRSLDSVLSTGETVILPENHVGEFQTKQRPRWS
ncbi:MAG: hypothetical protein NTX75_01815 [Proteobacteria bacterium]|nr:hypothetical protein [Pseudomonadota bacterium]